MCIRVLLCAGIAPAAAYDTEPRRGLSNDPHLLIDTDPGIDDALAILLALRLARGPRGGRHHRRRQCRGGPRHRQCPPHPRGRRARCRSRRVAGGAAAPLKRALVTAGHVHGQDGLGNLDRFVEPDGRPRYPEPTYAIEMRSGADVILETADRLGRRADRGGPGAADQPGAGAPARPAAARAGRAAIVVMGGASRCRATSRRPPSSTSTSIRRRPRRCSRPGCRSSWSRST